MLEQIDYRTRRAAEKIETVEFCDRFEIRELTAEILYDALEDFGGKNFRLHDLGRRIENLIRWHCKRFARAAHKWGKTEIDAETLYQRLRKPVVQEAILLLLIARQEERRKLN